jgi:hypothetical protein
MGIITRNSNFFMNSVHLNLQEKKLNFLPKTIDSTKIHTLLYHFPDGETLELDFKNAEDLEKMEFRLGKFCDTSGVNGILHFYPCGNS